MNLKKHSMFLLTGAFILVLLAGCNFGIGGGGAETLAAYDVELSDGLESKIPLPKGSEIRSSINDDDTYGVVFTPGTNYPDSIAFFSETFASSDWDVEKEDIPEESEGERTAEWVLWADGMAVDLHLTAFGDEEGFNMTGVYSIYELDESLRGAEYISRNIQYNRINYEGENLRVPETLADDIPVIEDANIFNITTFDEETEAEGQGFTEIILWVEGTYDDVVAYYEQALEEIEFYQDEDDDSWFEPNYLRGDEELYISVREDFEGDGRIGVTMRYFDENAPKH